MNIQEKINQFEKNIASKKDENATLLPLLKSLTASDKKALTPIIKKLYKKYAYDADINHQKSKYKDKIIRILQASVVCFNRTDLNYLFKYANMYGHPNRCLVSDEIVETILPWYCPDWYTELLNDPTKVWFSYHNDYDSYMNLYKKGYVKELNPSVVAHRLYNSIQYGEFCEFDKYEETPEHFGYLFKYPTFNPLYIFEGTQTYKKWFTAMLQFFEQGKLSRRQVLSDCFISTENLREVRDYRRFVKNHYETIAELNPTEDELISLQDDLFIALKTSLSSIAKQVLNYLKKIVSHKEFNALYFLEISSELVVSKTKTIVNATLPILEKIAKTNPQKANEVAIKVAEGLLSTDEKIQLKIAKIIQKYGDVSNEELKSVVSFSASTILTKPKAILTDFIEEKPIFEDEVISVDFLCEERKIPIYKTIDDLIFFVTQALENNESYHTDLLMNYLPKLAVLLTKNDVSKLIPFFNRAEKISEMYSSRIPKNMGKSEQYSAYLVNIFAELLSEKYPEEMKECDAGWKNDEGKILFYWKHKTEPLSTYDYHNIYNYLRYKSKVFLEENRQEDFLSTPTHEPCWIAPEILIQRLNSYEKLTILDLYDFQIAINRLPIYKFSKDLQKEIKALKHNEIRQILNYHFGFLLLEEADITSPEWWLSSIISRNKPTEITFFEQKIGKSLNEERGLFPWDFIPENKETALFYTGRKELCFVYKLNEQMADGEYLKDVFAPITKPNEKQNFLPSIYNPLNYTRRRCAIDLDFPNDMVKFLSLQPNNLGVVLHQQVSQFLYVDAITRVPNLTESLKMLNEIWYRSDCSESSYLFIATLFFNADKSIRQLTAQFWLKVTAQNTLNNTVLGEILGKLQQKEYGMLRRFTDVIVSDMLNISKKYNEDLVILLDAMLSEMPEQPVKGFKKLLVIFKEALSDANGYKISEKTLKNFEKWKSVKSLKSLVSKL